MLTHRSIERARSLSPNKDSPLVSAASSIKPASSVMENYRASPTPPLERGSPAPSDTPFEARRNRDSTSVRNSATPLAHVELEPSKPSPPPSNTNTLSRSNTLSWQQRPSSRGSGSRPLSMLSQENRPQRSPRLQVESQEQASQEVSRAEAARSLEGKDPSWFRQTADRGKGSAAYRRNLDEVSNGTNATVRLPGMSNGSQRTREEQNPQTDDVDKRSSGESMAKSTYSTPQSSTTMTQSSRSKSPLPLLPSQRLDPSQNENNSFAPVNSSPTRGLAMSPSQRSLSPDRAERPSSPTKGLGGFVQSAMLKRSDSINKHARANSQATPSLSRSNSVLNTHDEDREDISKAPNPGEVDTFAKPALPIRTLSQRGDSSPSNDQAETSPPSTPSRTLDSKRWSPTKTTWLENAIQKSDSPRPKSIQQKPPMWLSELQKSKQEGTSSEDNKPANYKTVEIGGFMRSPPLVSASKSPGLAGFASPSIDGRSPAFSRTNSSTNKSGMNRFETLSAPTSQASPALLTASLSRTTSGPSGSVSGDRKVSPSGQPTAAETTLRKVSTESKSKPATPPKKDLWANLKSRDAAKGPSTAPEAEFKNVFGKLKKTETKNYVAPDELKNNITRGKAGLAVTGGPRPYEKRDEFKDSLLKKKEEMKTSGSIRGKPTPAPKPATSAVPEAIARQRGLATRDVSKEVESPTKDIFPSFSGDKKSQAPPTPPAEQLPPRLPPQRQTSVQAGLPKQAIPEKKTSAPGRLQVGSGGSSSNLADRFNPTLASLIARGPSPMSTAGPSARTASPGPVEDMRPSPDISKSNELTHATKSRARGPKRRLPASNKTSDDVATPPEKPESTIASTTTGSAKPPSPRKPSITAVSGLGIMGSTIAASAVADEPTSPRTVTAPSAQTSYTRRSDLPIKETESTAFGDASSSISQTRSVTPSLNVLSTSATLAPKTPPAVKPKRIASETQTVGDLSPSKVGIAPSPAPSSTQTAYPKSPKSPPVPTDKSKALAKIASNESPKPEIKEPKANSRSPTRPSKPPPKLLADFFENTASAKSKASINTLALLTGGAASEGKIKTLRKEIWELGSDGKKSPLASHQEHILFEDKMYICKHVFGSTSGKRTTEVYLWCGDQVSQSAVEDSQLFARNEAKDAGGKLQVLSQGKEPANFFDALGGIVITRRTSAATYTLCGRRHMGQIAFDEVEHSTQSLCSGFPFIVSAPDGSLYLWKGKGANADELGCARLIGMDLGVSGEIAEIDEGKETPSFFKALGSTARSKPLADYWSLKGNHEKYGTRLFVIDTEARPKSASSFTGLFTRRPSAPSNEDLSGQIREISPFCEADISKDGIYMLDAFFEIYM